MCWIFIAPHEKIHGFKDFLVHLFTITIGLLIALGLEGCAERVLTAICAMRQTRSCGRRFVTTSAIWQRRGLL